MRISAKKIGAGDEPIRCNGQMLLLFLTGTLLGWLLVRHFGLSGSLTSEFTNQQTVRFGSDFFLVFWAEAKFLLMLYLLSFQRWGAMLVPPVFGLEGLYFGMAFSGLVSSMGTRGAVVALLLMLFRLLLILPYGFLLGGWAIERSLSFPDSRGQVFAVLAVTLFVMLLGAFLESTLARWLGMMYYLKFGV